MSLKNQKDKRFKVYIGNYNSPHDPEILINESLKDIDYKYIHYTENLGGKNLVLQWERVISEVGDEKWMMILGDDDVLGENVVEQFYQNIPLAESLNISLMKFSRYTIDEKNNVISEKTQLPDVMSSVKFLEKKLHESFPNTLSEHVYKREIYEKFKFKKFPMAWHSDDVAILEFSNVGNFLFISDAFLNIRISTQSISGKDNSVPDKQKAGYEYLEYLLKNYFSKFSQKTNNLLLKRYIESIWRNGYKMNIDIVKYHFKNGNFLRAIYSFYVKWKLKKNIER